MSTRGGAQAPRRAAALGSDLRAIWVDGLAWAVMVGMGEQAFSAFAVALGLAVPWGGLVATLPMVAGALLQLTSPLGIRRLGSHRRWVILCVGVQAAAFAPLALGAFLGAMPGWLLYVVASVYWWGALGSAPAWSTWIATLVPSRVRIRYFARRTRWLQVLQITALVAAGWILQAGEGWAQPLRAFSIVFLFALVARTLSVACLVQQSEPDPMPGGMRAVPPREYVARLRRGEDGRLLGYMLAVQLAANVAGPFYVPYLLRELSFSYAQVMTVLAAAVLAKFASLPLHGRFAERHGVRALLWLGGTGVPLSVALWLLTDRFELLCLAQLFAGFTWSAWELATFLLFFDAIRPEERTSVLTSHHAANAAAVASGSLVGGWALSAAGGGRGAFLLLFALSAALRLLTLPLLGRVARRPALSGAGWSRFTAPALKPAARITDGRPDRRDPA